MGLISFVKFIARFFTIAICGAFGFCVRIPRNAQHIGQLHFGHRRFRDNGRGGRLRLGGIHLGHLHGFHRFGRLRNHRRGLGFEHLHSHWRRRHHAARWHGIGGDHMAKMSTLGEHRLHDKSSLVGVHLQRRLVARHGVGGRICYHHRHWIHFAIQIRHDALHRLRAFGIHFQIFAIRRQRLHARLRNIGQRVPMQNNGEVQLRGGIVRLFL